MATDRNLFTVARVTKPADIKAALPNLQRLAGDLPILDGRQLRVRVERFINRSLLWEEWLDIRRDWCNTHHAFHCDAVLGDALAVENCAQTARMQGYEYLLLEVI